MSLLDKYVIISCDCGSYWLWAKFYPNVDRMFIPYNSPLTAHLFRDDDDFLKFCENYDDYVSKEPEIFILPGDEDAKGYKFEGLKEVIRTPHDQYAHPELLKTKWRGRALLGQGKEKIFIWSAGHFVEPPNEEKRSEMITRFNNLDGWTIFLTELAHEKDLSTEKHIVKFVDEWGSCTQHQRANGKWNPLVWNLTDVDGGVTIPIFKKLIEENVFVHNI